MCLYSNMLCFWTVWIHIFFATTINLAGFIYQFLSAISTLLLTLSLLDCCCSIMIWLAYMFQWLVTYSFLQYFLLVLVIYFSGYIFLCVGWHLFFQDAGVHALSNVCHVDVERISKRKPGEVVCTQNLLLPLSLNIRRAHILTAVLSDYDLNVYQKP